MGVKSSTSLYLYVDGVLVASSSGANPAATSGTSNVYIGSPYGASNWWDGKIDEVKVFQYALTKAQVRNLFNEGAAFFGPSEGP